MEHGARKQASTTLKALLDEGFRPDDMRLYLARAAELDQDPSAAIEHYMQVGSGQNLSCAPAFRRPGCFMKPVRTPGRQS
jgi:hypothetical protein